eukprot:sb/3470755/
MAKRGVAVGTHNHSCKFPPQVVDTMFKVVTDAIGKYIAGTPYPGLQLPISITIDGDTYRLRKRLPILIRLVDTDPESSDLLRTVYVSHPPAEDESGEGIAKTMIEALKTLIPDQTILSRSLKTLVVDGGMAGLNLKYHLCKQLGIPETGRVYIWDYPHIEQRVWEMTLSPPKGHPGTGVGKVFANVIEDVENITLFFK